MCVYIACACTCAHVHAYACVHDSVCVACVCMLVCLCACVHVHVSLFVFVIASRCNVANVKPSAVQKQVNKTNASTCKRCLKHHRTSYKAATTGSPRDLQP